MMIWLVLLVLCLLALAFVVIPLYRNSGFFRPKLGLFIALIFSSSFFLYALIGQPISNLDENSIINSDFTEVIDSISEHLADNPEDIEGWLMLGRSQQMLQKYDDAVSSFERALELDDERNSQVLVALSIALMEQKDGDITERSSRLLEEALAIDPNNVDALFYGGGAAARRGDLLLAADRWEILLETNSLNEIHEFLRKKINEWRGLAMNVNAGSKISSQTVINLNISLSNEVISLLPIDTTVYIIARDPSNPTPPVAVIRRQLIDFPSLVNLSDKDSMIPNRKLSDFSQIEVIARASISGEPIAKPGDWSGSMVIKTNSDQTFDLIINKITP